MGKAISYRKQFIWLPYTKSIALSGKSVRFVYKGGELATPLSKIHSVMFYGSVCPLEQEFLEKCCLYGIPLTIHRRNMSKAVWIIPSTKSNREDLLTKQILFRQSEKKRVYITKRLIAAKFKSMEWLLPAPFYELHGLNSVSSIVAVEAWYAKRYWKRFYELLGCPESSRRSKGNFICSAMDAASKFMSGIILRWIIYHQLSPFHGYTHIPSDYPALVYDVMEPYRGYIDKVVFDTVKEMQKEEVAQDKTVPYMIENLKYFMDKEVYVNATRQVVTFQELYHGLILSLRSYLLGNKRFIVPLPGNPNGGRPIKAGYKLYGRAAGKTDFWPETKEISQEFQRNFSIRLE